MKNRLLKTCLILVLAIAGWTPRVHAEPTSALEARIREKLDRMFTTDQYLIDLQTSAPLQTSGSLNTDTLLPGLELLGSTSVSRGDLLLIIDKSISRERVRVAEDLVKRIVKGERLDKNVRVSVRQQDILKVPSKLPEPAAPAKEPSFFDHLNANKDLVTRALFILWGAVISLMAAHFALKRFLGSMKSTEAEETARSQRKASDEGATKSAGSSDAPQRKLAASKEELYSKDQAILNSINEIVGEAKTAPRKVAKIFTRWVAQSEDNARFASIFLKNCDIKTIESICSLLHPSDIEKILTRDIQEFDPFGEENQRVLERMRADLAFLAAEQLLKEKPDPLDFMRTLSDDDISLVLQGEGLETLALVATQIPAHRLMRFYAGLKPETLNDIMALIAKIHAPSLENFNVVRERLQKKTATLSISLFNDKTRKQTIAHLIDSVLEPATQIGLLDRLREENKGLYALVRAQIFTATDLNHLTARAVTVLIQTLDPGVLATSVSGLKQGFDGLTEQLPEAYRAIFIDGMHREVDEASRQDAWKRVKTTLKELVANGMITQSEITTAIHLAEEALEGKGNADQMPEERDVPYAS